MRRGIQTGAAVAAVFVLATCGREPSPTGGPGESTSATVDHSGGRVELGGLTLVIPAGALSDATTITVRQLAEAPWGAIGGVYDFGPDGLRFAVPARLTVDFAEDELPAGVRAESLALNVIEDGRWMPLDGGEVDVEAGTVSALVSHFSTFGIVADPTADAGAGTRWEANGVVAESSAEVVARLWVSSDLVTLLVDGQGTAAADVTLSGLPTDAPVHVYVDSVEDERMLEPSDGGTMTLHLELDRPRFVWMQFHHSTTGIGGPNDMCTNTGVDGVRVGNTCTLTHDLVGTVEIGDDDQVLDCAGHRIAADPAAVGEGFGIRIVGWHGVEVRNCTVGGPGAGFSIGLGAELSGWPADGSGLTVTGCTFEDNYTGVRLEQVRVAGVRDSAVLRSWRGVEVASKSEMVVFERVQVEPPAVAAEKAIGFATEGLLGKENIYYIPQDCSFLDGSIAGVGTGVALGMSREIEVRDTDLTNVRTGLLIRAAAMAGTDPTAPPEWTHRFWHNNVAATAVGVSSFAGPIEVSWVSQGSFWNRTCPGPLFVPGIDSDRADVGDSFAYGTPSGWLAGGSPGCVPGDSDGDTVPDAVDNCPDIPNPGQENTDGTGAADACDTERPSAPFVRSPVAGSVLVTTNLVVTGDAEPLSTVFVFVDGRDYGSAPTSASGEFSVVSTVPLEEGPARIWAVAQDAAGLQSPSSTPVGIVVDLGPPPPPVMESPGEGEVVATGLVSFRGVAEPQTDVAVTANGVVVARCRATVTGQWECPAATALESGGYSAFAVASDVAGHVSDPGSVRTFTVRIVSVDDPLGSIGAKFDVTEVSASPNPFDATTGPTTLRVTAAVDAISGLTGRSPNHEFNFQVRWTLRDRSGSWVRDLVSTTVIRAGDRPPPHRITVSTDASWNATDQSGALVPLEQHYPYDLAVSIIRRYVGPGRGPACGRGEEPLTSSPGACIIDRLNISLAGSLRPVDRSSPLYGQRPRYSPSGKTIFTLSEAPASLVDPADAERWVNSHATHVRTVANLSPRSAFRYRTTINDKAYHQHLFDHWYDGLPVLGDTVEVVVPEAGARREEGIPPEWMPPLQPELRLELSRPATVPQGIPAAVEEVARRNGVEVAAISRYIGTDRYASTTYPVYVLPLFSGTALRVNERGIVFVDERVPFAFPPPDPDDPVLRQGVWYHSFPYWAFDDASVPMPYTHVYPGGTTMPNAHGASDPAPTATTDGTGSISAPSPSPTGYGTGATGFDWRATCSASYFGDVGYSFPSASGPVAFDIGSHQERFFAGFSLGAGEWMLPEPATSGRSNLLGAATAQVYFVLNNVTHAYRQIGMDTPATLLRGTATDPRPFFFCINDVPFGMAYDSTSDTAFSANDADRVMSCMTDADCKVCVDYAVGGGAMEWRCAADTRQRCTGVGDTCERNLSDANPYNDQIPFCDIGHSGDDPGTGVCSMGWHSGGLTYKDGIHWLIGAFYDYLGSPRGTYGRMDAQSNVSHEAQHALACVAFADDLLTPGVDESKPCVNALESWAAGARNGFAVYAVLNEARGELPDRVLNHQRVPWFYHDSAQRHGRNSVYGGSCEAEEGTYDASATTHCGWDDPGDDFKCVDVCDDPSAGLPRVHYCTAALNPGAGPCAGMPDKYNDGMNILLDIFSEYSDSAGGFYGLADGLRAWRLNQAQGRTTWVTGTDSFRAMIEDADWAGDRWSLVSRAFHPHVRRMRVPFSDDVPGQREFADPMGYPTRLPVERLAQLGHPLDTDAYSFFAEAGVPLRIEAELLDLIDLSVCAEGTCSPGPGAPHPSVGDTVTVLFTPSTTGFHLAQVVPRGAFVGPGRYRLTIDRLVPDAPDTAAAAEPIPTSGVDVVADSVWIHLPPEPDEDEDWYRFWFAGASTTGVVRIALRVAGEHAGPGAIRAEMMRLDGSHSRELLVGDNDLVLDESDQGSWYIKVVGASIAGPVDYSLRVSVPLPGDREVCPGLTTGASPAPGCWLGEQETSVVTADLWGSHASTPTRGLERTEDIDEYLVCLDQDQSVSVFLRDGVQRLRMELRNPIVRDPVTGDEVPILGPGGGRLAWSYNVDNDRNVSASDVLLMSAEHGNAPGAGGPVLHFVSPNTQCYVLSVRASFGDDRVEEWDSHRRIGLDDELFWASARYDLFVVKGCVPGETGCTTIQPVPTLY